MAGVSSAEAELLKERSRMYRVMKTVEQMCIDRRTHGPAEWAPKSIEDFTARYCTPDGTVDRTKMSLQCREVPRGQAPRLTADPCMIVFFSGDAMLTAKSIADFSNSAAQLGVPRVLVIHKGKTNTHTKQATVSNKLLLNGKKHFTLEFGGWKKTFYSLI